MTSLNCSICRKFWTTAFDALLNCSRLLSLLEGLYLKTCLIWRTSAVEFTAELVLSIHSEHSMDFNGSPWPITLILDLSQAVSKAHFVSPLQFPAIVSWRQHGSVWAPDNFTHSLSSAKAEERYLSGLEDFLSWLWWDTIFTLNFGQIRVIKELKGAGSNLYCIFCLRVHLWSVSQSLCPKYGRIQSPWRFSFPTWFSSGLWQSRSIATAQA